MYTLHFYALTTNTGGCHKIATKCTSSFSERRSGFKYVLRKCSFKIDPESHKCFGNILANCKMALNRNSFFKNRIYSEKEYCSEYQ